MKKARFEKRIVAVLTLIIIIICAIGYYTYTTMTSIARSIQEEVRPDENLVLVKDISDHINTADISTRSYSMTGNRAYLYPYYQAIVSMEKKTERLQKLPKRQNQQVLADSIAIFVEKKIDILDNLVQISENNGQHDALSKVSESIKKTATPLVYDTILLKKDSTVKRKNFLGRLFSKKKSEDMPAVVQQRRDTNPMEEEILRIKKEQERVKRTLNREQQLLSKNDSAVMATLSSLIFRFEDGEKISIREMARDADRQSQKASILIGVFCFLLVLMLSILGYVIVEYLQRSKETQLALVEAKQSAENLAQAKESFLNSMSHEIRTPMNAISGFTDQLMSTVMDYEQRQYVDIIKRSTTHLIKIVNDILDFSRMNAGKMTVENVSFHFREVFEECAILFEFECIKKNIRMDLDIDPNIPLVLIGDPGKLRQVLLNLLGNAIKFTDEGVVRILVNFSSQSEKKIQLRVQIIDSGIGINAEKLNRVFTEFDRVDDVVTSGREGSGLGLSISKKLVEICGGTIGISSKEGQGTTVDLSIPYAVADIKAIEELYDSTSVNTSNIANLGKLKVLIVDDAEYNRLLLHNIMRKWKFEFDACINGKEAVELAAKNDYDIILMDVVMPVMNGFEAIVNIRRREDHRKVPILMMTAAFTPEIESRAISSGANAVLSKPFAEQQLLAKISSLVKINVNENPTQGEVQNNNPMSENDPHAYFNLRELKRVAGADKKYFKELSELFISNTSEGITKLKQLYADEKWAELAELARALSGPCRHLEAFSLCEVLRMIETAAGSQPGIENMHLLFEKLEEEAKVLSTKLTKG